MLGATWGTSQLVILLIEMAVGVVFGVLGAIRMPMDVRVMNAARSALAACFFVAYLWLLGHQERRAEWSEVMSGFAVVAWPVLIIYPAALTWWRRHKIEDHSKKR